MDCKKKRYRIDSRYSIILKKDGTLLCTDVNKSTMKLTVDSSEIYEINEILNHETFEIGKTKILKKLLHKKIIIEDKEYKNFELYLNQFLNATINVHELQSKTVAIIGLGGIGSEIVNHLIGVGVQNYVLIDFDEIEHSNFNRQYMFALEDIGKTKIDVIESRIKGRIDNSQITKINKKISDSNDLIENLKESKPDFLICAADTPFLDIRISILKTAMELTIPCVFGGVSVLEGQVGPLFTDNKKIKIYLDELKKYKEIVLNNNINKASFGPTNTIISAYMAKDIIFVLLGYNKRVKSLNKILTINFESGNVYETKQF